MNPPPLFIDGTKNGVGKPGTILVRQGNLLRRKGWDRFKGHYRIIDMTDPIYALSLLDKTLGDYAKYSSNPLVWGKGDGFSPPSLATADKGFGITKEDKRVWRDAQIGKTQWEKLIGKHDKGKVHGFVGEDSEWEKDYYHA